VGSGGGGGEGRVETGKAHTLSGFIYAVGARRRATPLMIRGAFFTHSSSAE
jgi:hypothetical protein